MMYWACRFSLLLHLDPRRRLEGNRDHGHVDVSRQELGIEARTEMSAVSTLVDLLCLRARQEPGLPGYSFLLDGEEAEARLTYAELDRRARGLGAALQHLGATGERALLLYP